MDSKRIEKLLERYWAGETSLEEEQQLKAYFRTEGVAEQHRETAALFRYFDERKKNEIKDSQFADQVISKVKPKGKRVSFFYNSLRIAAGISVLVIATWFIRQEVRTSDPVPVEDTYADPKIAFEETKKALQIISKSFGKAEEQTRKINLFNKAQEEIQKPEKEKKL